MRISSSLKRDKWDIHSILLPVWYFCIHPQLNPFYPDPGQREKINLIFIFTLLCGASEVLWRPLKTFIKPFEAPQISVKIKI